jgi:hypothetical protein
VTRLLDSATTGPLLAERLVDAIRQSPLDLDSTSIDVYTDEPVRLGDLDVDRFVVEDAQELDERQLLVRLRARGEVLLELTVWRDDYVEAEHEGVALDPFEVDRGAFGGELWVVGDIAINDVIGLDGTVPGRPRRPGVGSRTASAADCCEHISPGVDVGETARP